MTSTPCAARSIDEGLDGREVVAATAWSTSGQRIGLARGADAEIGEVAIVLLDGPVMAGRRPPGRTTGRGGCSRSSLQSRPRKKLRNIAVSLLPDCQLARRPRSDAGRCCTGSRHAGRDRRRRGRVGPRAFVGLGSRSQRPICSEMVGDRPPALAIGPSDEREHRPPSVADQRVSPPGATARTPRPSLEPGAAARRPSPIEAVSEIISGDAVALVSRAAPSRDDQICSAAYGMRIRSRPRASRSRRFWREHRIKVDADDRQVDGVLAGTGSSSACAGAVRQGASGQSGCARPRVR